MDTVSYKDALHLKIHQDKPAREPHSRAVQDSAEATETLINKPQVRNEHQFARNINAQEFRTKQVPRGALSAQRSSYHGKSIRALKM